MISGEDLTMRRQKESLQHNRASSRRFLNNKNYIAIYLPIILAGNVGGGGRGEKGEICLY